jgi:hypothetical protein
MEATKENNPFQIGGITPNIWIEKTLRELLMASNKLFPGVIDTIPSDKSNRGHAFSRDLYWLSCGEL